MYIYIYCIHIYLQTPTSCWSRRKVRGARGGISVARDAAHLRTPAGRERETATDP